MPQKPNLNSLITACLSDIEYLSQGNAIVEKGMEATLPVTIKQIEAVVKKHRKKCEHSKLPDFDHTIRVALAKKFHHAFAV